MYDSYHSKVVENRMCLDMRIEEKTADIGYEGLERRLRVRCDPGRNRQKSMTHLQNVRRMRRNKNGFSIYQKGKNNEHFEKYNHKYL